MTLRKIQVSTRSRNNETATGSKYWHGIIGNGQSLSIGFQAPLTKPTKSAPDAFRLQDKNNEYDIEKPASSSLELVQLTEPFRSLPQNQGPNFYPWNIDGLTPHHAMARTISFLCRRQHPPRDPYVTVHTAVGKGGAPMHEIQKHDDPERNKQGHNAYAASIYEAEALTRLVKSNSQGETESNAHDKNNGMITNKLHYDAIIFTHGEADSIINNEEYDDELIKMQSDYAADLRAITGQQHDPVLILSQQNTCPPFREFLPTIMDRQWKVQRKAGGDKVICSGPKYQFDYAPGGLHLDGAGYNRLGEKYGQVYYETVVQGRPFLPLSPNSAVLVPADHKGTTDGQPAQSVIRVQFHVPVPPLRWDELLPRPHEKTRCAEFWSEGRGFEVRDAATKAMLRIENVCIDAEDGDDPKSNTRSVKIVLAPDAPNIDQSDDNDNGAGNHSIDQSKTHSKTKRKLNLAYAMTQEGEGFGPGFCGGTSDGRMGWLCDSDPGPAALEDVLSDCHVQRGSAEVVSFHSATNDGDSNSDRDGDVDVWANRALYDLIRPVNVARDSSSVAGRAQAFHNDANDADVPEYTIVKFKESKVDPERGTRTKVVFVLDRAWEGPSGTGVDLRIRHNQRNYCVSFSLDVDID